MDALRPCLQHVTRSPSSETSDLRKGTVVVKIAPVFGNVIMKRLGHSNSVKSTILGRWSHDLDSAAHAQLSRQRAD